MDAAGGNIFLSYTCTCKVETKSEQSMPLLLLPPYLYGVPYQSSMNAYSFTFFMSCASTPMAWAYFSLIFFVPSSLVTSLCERQELIIAEKSRTKNNPVKGRVFKNTIRILPKLKR